MSLPMEQAMTGNGQRAGLNTSTILIRAALAQVNAGWSALTCSRLKRIAGTSLLAAMLLLLFCAEPAILPIQAQTISATLSGFVEDQTGAIVPGASVTLTNQASKDKRSTKTDSSGLFNFAAVPSGDYQVQITMNGFSSFVERDIHLNPADQRTLKEIKLQVGSVQTEITVNSTGNNMPTEGAKSTVITSEDIARLPVEGRDVTELIKTLPGFAQTAQGANANNIGPNTDTATSQTGNYTANGVTPEGVQIISDGVNVTDPGGEAGTDQVINMDNVAEVKVQMSNFGADSAKGPIVINAVGKSGGSDYHGELYVYGRTHQLNTQDWFSKYDGDAKPNDRYVYPGFNIGGPVRIPGTDFNHNKKWTFFLGAEDYIQREVYAYGSAQSATINALVPTCAMRGLGPTDANFNCTSTGQAADFGEASLTNYFGGVDPVMYQGNPPVQNCSPNGVLDMYQNICQIPSGYYPFESGTSLNKNPLRKGSSIAPGTGLLAASELDPGAMAYMYHVIPLPNTATLSRFGSLYNYKAVNYVNDDSYQARLRTDYNLSEKNKVYLVYSFQHTDGVNPQQTYYSPQDAFGEINTPGAIVSADFAHTGSLNYTSVITPSLTNEFYLGVNYNWGVVNSLNATATKAATIGYPSSYSGIYPTSQFPQLDDYGNDGLPLGIFPDFSTPVFQHKFVPNGGDNVTKVIKTHNIKVGTYIERTNVNETNLNDVSQGQIQNYYDGPNNAMNGSVTEAGTGQAINTQENYLASFELGLASAFNQYNFQTNSDLYYYDVDFYATDSWKATKKLSFDYGFRLGHLGPWQDDHHLGLAVWDPALYKTQTKGVLEPILGYTGVSGIETQVNVPGLVSPGFKWHGVDATVPKSGAGSTAVFFSPRFGLAYDVYGDGKTMVRGGIGAYRSHDSWNDVSAAEATSEGQAQSYIGGGGLALRDIPLIVKQYGGLANPTGANGCGCLNTSFGLQQGDTEQPLTWTYSFTVDQQLNPSTVFEISYQGSQSTHLLTQWEQGAQGDLENINALPIGSFFKPDPYSGQVLDPSDIVNDDVQGDYRPYPYYSQVNVIRHALYSNYNGLQVQVRKTQGRLLYNINYTWSKNMGVFGAYSTGNVIDSTNIRPNYGPLQGDRSDILNSTFAYDTGKFRYGNRLVRGILSSYDVSGIINLQSGANVQRVLGSNLGLSGQITNPPGSPSNRYTNYPISGTTYLGTTDVVLQPALLCDPRSGVNRAAHQYMNASCFALPQFGVNGPSEIPYIHAPAYFDFDARVSRQINLREKQNLQVQFSAFNVINRANYSFSSKFPTEQTLQFFGTTPEGLKERYPEDFGYAGFRFGRRVSEISLKYNF